MLRYTLLALIGLHFNSAVQAAEQKYNTHFVNPVVDDRIAFHSCAVQGALIGILENRIGDVLCWGPLKSEVNKKKPVMYYAYKAARRSTQDYFVLLDSKFLKGYGEQAGGMQLYSVTLGLLQPDLSKAKPPRRSTLKIRTEWFYSEGSTLLTGILPGKRETFGAPVFHLSYIDQELKDFAAEIGH